MSKNLIRNTDAEYVANFVRNGSVLYDGPKDKWSGTDDANGGIVEYGCDGRITSVSVFAKNMINDMVDIFTFGHDGRLQTAVRRYTGEDGREVSEHIVHYYDNSGALVVPQR
jgi:hypothetical protein